MVECLERFDYGAESCRESVSSRLSFAMLRLKTLSVNPAMNGYLFRNQGRLRQRKEGDGLRFSCAQDTVGL